jgi:hypothetical protein
VALLASFSSVVAVAPGAGQMKSQDDVNVLSVQGQALLEIAGGSRELPRVEISNAAVIEGHGLFRIEADCLVEIRDGAVVLSLVLIGHAAVVEGARGIWGQRETKVRG